MNKLVLLAALLLIPGTWAQTCHYGKHGPALALDVFPVATCEDVPNRFPANSVLAGQAVLTEEAPAVARPDLADAKLRKASLVVSFPSTSTRALIFSLPPFDVHVRHVVGVRSEKKVLGINTSPVVAAMKNEKFRKLPVGKVPGEPVGRHSQPLAGRGAGAFLHRNAVIPVAVATLATLPQPTALGPRDETPEPLSGDGEGRNLGPHNALSYDTDNARSTAKCHYRWHGPAALPDSGCTPGVDNPSVTQENIKQTICRSGWTKTIRPSDAVMEKIKDQLMVLYGNTVPQVPPLPLIKRVNPKTKKVSWVPDITKCILHSNDKRCYELDHYKSLENGGHPIELKNLWPQPYWPKPAAHEKDAVETWLNHQVCAGNMTLDEDRMMLRTDWVSAYNYMLQMKKRSAVGKK